MNTEQRDKCMAIFNHYGFEHQLDKTQEELSELHRAIDIMRLCSSNGQRYISGLAAHDLMDELADTLIMATQLAHAYGVNRVNERIDYKLDRQLKRIEEEKKAEFVLGQLWIKPETVTQEDFKDAIRRAVDSLSETIRGLAKNLTESLPKIGGDND